MQIMKNHEKHDFFTKVNFFFYIVFSYWDEGNPNAFDRI